jgi:carbamate kinase
VHGNGPQDWKSILTADNVEEALEQMHIHIARTQEWIGEPLVEAIERLWKLRAEVHKTIALCDSMGEGPKVKGLGPKVPDRPIVCSPEQLSIVGIDEIREMMRKGIIPIFGGGGGVLKNIHTGKFIPKSVGDKDDIAARGARMLGADRILTCTDTDGVQENFGTPEVETIPWLHPYDEKLDSIINSVAGAGSMGPKAKGSRDFVRYSTGKDKVAVISNLHRTAGLVRGRVEDWMATTVISWKKPAYLDGPIEQWSSVEGVGLESRV